MKKLLCFIGSALYSVIISYLIWLLFTWITPFILSWGWLLAIIYWIFALGLISGLLTSISSFMSVPLIIMVLQCKASKYLSILPLLFFGYCAIVFPWKANFDYTILQYLIAFSISSTAFAIYSAIIQVLLFGPKEK